LLKQGETGKNQNCAVIFDKQNIAAI